MDMMIDTDKLKEYLQCDDAFLKDVINNFLDESTEMIGKLKNGASAGNHETMRSAAHKMLSSTRILELDELTSELEKVQKKSDHKKSMDEIQPLVDKTLNIWSKTKEGLEQVKEKLN